MMSIAFKEGVSFPPAALNRVIVAANQDIRQVCHCTSLINGHVALQNTNSSILNIVTMMLSS